MRATCNLLSFVQNLMRANFPSTSRVTPCATIATISTFKVYNNWFVDRQTDSA